MGNKSLWGTTKSLLVVLNYVNEAQLKDYRRALDQILDKSHVKKLTIVVIVPKEIDKSFLPPHFLIYYHNPNDFSLWGKLKDILLSRELEKKFDLLIWLGSKEHKIFNLVKTTECTRKVAVNCCDPLFFDMRLDVQNDQPSSLLNYVINTINKIEVYE
jgi:hypothetical protein